MPCLVKSIHEAIPGEQHQRKMKIKGADRKINRMEEDNTRGEDKHLETFATMEAAAMHMLVASPFTIQRLSIIPSSWPRKP